MTIFNVAFPVSIPTTEQLGFELCIMSFFKALGEVAPHDNDNRHAMPLVDIVVNEKIAVMQCGDKRINIATRAKDEWAINPELVIDQTNWFYPQGKDGGGAPHRRGTNRPERGPWI